MNSVGKAVRLAVRLLQIAMRNPSRMSHVLGTALAASDEVADPGQDLLRLRGVSPEQLLPATNEGERAVLALYPKTHASLSVLESVCLILLLKKAKAGVVFEFGTYLGVSITQLALNLGPNSRVYTLDLPEEQANIRFDIPDPDEREIALEGGKGSLVPAELKSRVTFLQQDSAAFDEKPYAGKIDFVFVDGAHSADYIRNDSEKGWRMLRSGGIIAWHDCRIADPAVVRYLLSSPFRPARIEQTSLAFATKT